MTKKSRSEQKEPPPNAIDAEGSPAAQLPTFPEMTSSEYRRLSGGNLEQKLVTDYIKLAKLITQEQILEQQMRTLEKAGAKDCQQALTRAQEIHQETLWEARRKLVATMNLATLESLAKDCGISPGSELIRNHPDADDLEKGLLLARLRQFLDWDVKYLGTAGEMRAIDVEAALEAARGRTKKTLPSTTDSLESVLRYASACKEDVDEMLIPALKDCIAITCACPEVERGLVLKIQHIQSQAEDLKEQVRDLDENVNPPKERVMGADEKHESLGQLITYLKQTLEKIAARSQETGEVEDDRLRQTFTDLKSDTQKLDSRHNAAARSLDEVRSYREQFAPGKDMPQMVEDARNKWFTSQFTEGKPVGSIVRKAWLFDVFHSFWKVHQSSYLASDPKLKNRQQEFSIKGKTGAAKKTDVKWRRSTGLFVEYATSTAELKGNYKPEKIRKLIDTFGRHLIDQKTRGASDKRTVDTIKVFLSTLANNMDRDGNDCSPHAILEILRDNTGNRGRGGQFRNSPFTTLTVETVEACLEILRAGLKTSQALKDRAKRPGTNR